MARIVEELVNYTADMSVDPKTFHRAYQGLKEGVHHVEGSMSKIVSSLLSGIWQVILNLLVIVGTAIVIFGSSALFLRWFVPVILLRLKRFQRRRRKRHSPSAWYQRSRRRSKSPEPHSPTTEHIEMTTPPCRLQQSLAATETPLQDDPVTSNPLITTAQVHYNATSLSSMSSSLEGQTLRKKQPRISNRKPEPQQLGGFSQPLTSTPTNTDRSRRPHFTATTDRPFNFFDGFHDNSDPLGVEHGQQLPDSSQQAAARQALSSTNYSQHDDEWPISHSPVSSHMLQASTAKSKLLYRKASINGVPISVLIDTGASVSLLSQETFEEIQAANGQTIQMLPPTISCVSSASGHDLHVKGS
ncbi:MAG: retroviral-like aspartic protease, partial [Gammaproteobacteria bacterium]|nr:retroviral-like aspartic protease [Gammaproteobacteria bacterium]